jgi:hypothetical protein
MDRDIVNAVESLIKDYCAGKLPLIFAAVATYSIPSLILY